MSNVDVSIVSWNSVAELRGLLQDLQRQTLRPTRVTVVDNGSADASVACARQFADVQVVVLDGNTGFAHAHNVGIGCGTSTYVLVVNPDVRLASTYLAELVHVAERTPKAGALVGVVRRPDGSVDTTGLRVHRTRLVRERTSVPTTVQPVFGVSGAVALYRREALHDVAVTGHVFNETLFAYKEDVELAWRLQWGGWEAFCVPAAHAQHVRAVSTATRRSQRDTNRRYLSYRNHLLLYATVEQAQTFWPDAWAIVPAEVGRLVYLLCADFRTTLRALADAGKMWHAAKTFAAREPRRLRAAALRAQLAL